MAQVIVRFWAGAQSAAGHAEESMDVATLAEVRAEFAARPKLTKVSAVAAFLIDGVQGSDSSPLADGMVIDVLPPFAGG